MKLLRECRAGEELDELRTAFEMFTALGIEAFAGRAERELLATGERVRTRSVETREELTTRVPGGQDLRRDLQPLRHTTTLEAAETGLVFASGMGALATTVLGLVSRGDHIVAQRSMYGGSLSLVQKLLSRLGVDHTLVDQSDAAAWESAITPATRLFLIESPSNPRLEITDLRAVADIARARGILTLADNTFATPVNQRPLEFGVDLVWHSATKYLAGHSDASAGVVVGPKHLIDQIWMTSLNIGAVLGPFDAWLVTRGIRTLDLRVRRHNDTAAVIAGHLSGRTEVGRVHYPGLETHAAHDVADRQMSGFGGVLSVELVGGLDGAARFVEHLELFQLSASLGSVESLVVHPASMWKAMLTEEELADAGLDPGLVRLACGQEDVADLIEDVDKALDSLHIAFR